VTRQLLSAQKSGAAGERGALATEERSNPDVDAGAVEAWVRLLRGHAGMRRTVSAQLQSEHGLTVNEYEALLLLSHAQDNQMRRVDLADGLQLTPSGVTRLLDGLRERRLVEKAECASDARVTYAVLTVQGAEKLRAASCSHVAAIRALLRERYSQGEIETLVELLGRLPGAGGCGAPGCAPAGCAP
jgi:DNA-binding MarR family transcriptional regulator